MKKAPLLGLAAVSILVATLGLVDQVKQPPLVTALDFAGVDTLVVDAADARVTLVATRPQLKFEAYHPPRVDVHRDGSALVVRVRGQDVADVEITAPPTLRVVEIASGTVRSKAPLVELEVRALDRFTWEGQVDTLRLRQARPSDRYCLKADACWVSFNIDARLVDHLDATLWYGNLQIQDPKALRRADLALGPKATFVLSEARKAPVIGVRDLPAADIPVVRRLAVPDAAGSMSFD